VLVRELAPAGAGFFRAVVFFFAAVFFRAVFFFFATDFFAVVFFPVDFLPAGFLPAFFFLPVAFVADFFFAAMIDLPPVVFELPTRKGPQSRPACLRAIAVGLVSSVNVGVGSEARLAPRARRAGK